MLAHKLFASKLAPLLFMSVGLSLGCSPSNPNAPATISGNVSYQGKPVKGGTLTFHTNGFGSYPVLIRPDGTYAATDMPAGDMVVTVETESINPDKKKPIYGDKDSGSKVMSPVPEGVNPKANLGEYVKIPPKYADQKKSGLTATLTTGKQSKDFDLTD